MSVISLSEFLETNYQINPLEIGANPLSSSIFIAPNDSKQLEIDRKEEQFTHLVHSCRVQILNAGHKSNVLVHGYQLTNQGAILKENYAHSTNKNGTFLANVEWSELHSKIGSFIMKDLLVNHSGFQVTGRSFNHLFGDSLEKFHSRRHTNGEVYFNLNRVLYRDGYTVQRLNPIPASKIGLLHEVFKQDYDKCANPKKILRKLYGFSKLCTQITSNHHKCRYLPILHEVCSERKDIGDNLELALKKKEIMRFMTICFESVFPREVYGNNKNKSIIFSNFSSLLLGERGFNLCLTDCLIGMKIKGIPWLGGNEKMNKQDHLKRVSLFTSFIQWLFSSYFPKLLASFFHITHISSAKELLFFHHSTWKRITGPFIQSYISTYLERSEEFSSVSQIEAMKSLYCVFRIMPKKNNDFRIINVPVKGSINIEIAEYLDRVNTEIRPSKRVLNSLRLSKPSIFPKLASIHQVPLRIFELKRKLLLKYDVLPQLFFLKFDIKACYDNISKEQVREALSKLIKPNDVYYYITQNELDLKSLTNKHRKIVQKADDIGELRELKRAAVFNASKSKVISIVGREVLNLTKSQLDHSFTKIGNKQFIRKKGIFQGLHLSSLFCDIVLDKLIEEKFMKDHETLALRIADDFMIISTNEEITSFTQKTIINSFNDYDISINQLKTFTNFDNSQSETSKEQDVLFCGITINTKDLSVFKQFDTSYSPTVRSHAQTIKKLIPIFKLRLSYHNLNTPLNSLVYRVEHVRSLTLNLATSYFQCTKHLKIQTEGFKKFIRELIIILKPIVMKEDLDNHELSIIVNFEQVLSQNRTKYKECIEYLFYRYEQLKQ